MTPGKDNGSTKNKLPEETGASAQFSDFEKAAMKQRAKELKQSEKWETDRAAGEKAILDKIAEMDKPGQAMAKRVHELITTTAPELMPRTWYGMPAYTKDGKVLVFYQDSKKFEVRYSTLGFNETAHLDEGDMWPVSFALLRLTPEVERRIVALLKKALG